MTSCSEVKETFIGHFYTKSTYNQLTRSMDFSKDHLGHSLTLGNALRSILETADTMDFLEYLLNIFFKSIEAKFQLYLETATMDIS